MPFSFSRRSGVLLLLVLTGLVLFVLTRHSSNPLSDATLVPSATADIEISSVVTPVLTDTPPPNVPSLVTQSGVKQVTETPEPTQVDMATLADNIDINKIRSSAVTVQVHRIEQGENYWTIAKRAHIDINTLIGANPNLPFKAAYRQNILLLSKKGVLHTVRASDSLSKIAERYRTTEKVIAEVNELHWWRPARTGDVLFIPDVRPVLMTQEWKDYFSKRGIFGVPFSRWATWTSGFGLRVDPFTGKHREHTGVDLRAKYGDAVYASAPGKVIFTGVAGGYGNLIQIAHSHGYVTYYGHLSKIYAHMGEKVRRGTLIGRVGATGRVTGPHLHFEIRQKGKPLDPLQFI